MNHLKFVRMIVLVSFVSQIACGQFSLDPEGPGGEPGDPGNPVFQGVSTVRAYAEDDPAKVMTIATADFDKKNGVDIATVQTDGMLNVLLNGGTGKLKHSYNNRSAVGSEPGVTYIQASDLNGDQAPDIVAADTKNSTFLIFLNNGDGTFADAASVAAGSSSGAKLAGLAVDDVNADGKLDVVTVARAGNAESTTLSLRTFPGNGDGTFGTQEQWKARFPAAFYLHPAGTSRSRI